MKLSIYCLYFSILFYMGISTLTSCCQCKKQDKIIVRSVIAKDPPPPVHCVFIHGAYMRNISHDIDEGIYYDVDNLPEKLKPNGEVSYWGSVKDWAESEDIEQPCTTYAFTYLDTVNRRYDDPVLMDYACEALIPKNNDGNPVRAGHKRIYLHSMGNLIFFEALRQKNPTCMDNYDKTVDNVYSFGAPFGKTKLLTHVKDICKTLNKYELYDHRREKLLKAGIIPLLWPTGIYLEVGLAKRKKAREMGVCTDDGNLIPAFASIEEYGQNAVKRNEMTKIAKEHIKGGICGKVPKFYKYLENSYLIFYNKMMGPSDFLVEVNSCRAGFPDHVKNNGLTYWQAPFHHKQIIGHGNEKEIFNFLKKLP